MAVVLANVLLVSLTVSPVILLLLLLMPRVGHRYTSRLRCAIWLLVTMRLLFPVHFSLRGLLRKSSSLANLLDQIDKTAVANALQKVMQEGVGSSGIVGQTSQGIFANGNLWGGFWLLGVGLFLCGNLIGYYAAVKRLRRWGMEVCDPFYLKIFAEAKSRLSISANIRLFRTSYTSTPLLVGFLHPRIYLPAIELSAAQFSDVVSHELCHYKRKDLWLKLAFLLSHALHWFNPIVYFMLRQAELDIEKACDSDVLRGAAMNTRKQYGLTILAFIEQAQTLPTPLTTYFYGGKKQMKSRFSDILSQKKKKSGIAFLTVFLLLILFCGAWIGTNAFAAPPEQEKNPTRSEIAALPESHENDKLAVLPAVQESGDMVWPVPGFYDILTPYGERFDGTDFHPGIDIGGVGIKDASVIAAKAGTVVSAVTNYTGYGKYIVIDHGEGITTLYAHLSEISVSLGDEVEAGQTIGTVGRSGHATDYLLQFEVRENGVAVDPVAYLMPV